MLVRIKVERTSRALSTVQKNFSIQQFAIAASYSRGPRFNFWSWGRLWSEIFCDFTQSQKILKIGHDRLLSHPFRPLLTSVMTLITYAPEKWSIKWGKLHFCKIFRVELGAYSERSLSSLLAHKVTLHRRKKYIRRTSSLV